MRKSWATIVTLDSVILVILAILLASTLGERRVGLAVLVLIGGSAWKIAMWRTLTRIPTAREPTASAILRRLQEHVAEEERGFRWTPQVDQDTSGLSTFVPGDRLG